jgi:hypothetical protein
LAGDRYAYHLRILINRLKTKRIDFEGITKAELHKKITCLLDKYDKDIAENNISVSKSSDTYNVSGSIKKFVFTFGIKAEIELFDNYIMVKYDTDVPESFRDTGFDKLASEIQLA